MNIHKFSAALVATGLLMASGQLASAPASAQTPTANKQKTQDGADSAFWKANDAQTNAQNKQRSSRTAPTQPSGRRTTIKPSNARRT